MRSSLMLTVLLPSLLQAETIVLLSDPWCPFACHPHQTRSGYMVDIAKEVFEPLGHHVQYRAVPFSRAEQEVKEGLAHGFVGVLKLPKRAAFYFPKEEQGLARVCFYTRPDTNWTYQDPNSLKGMHIGSTAGYSYGTEIDSALHSGSAKLDEVPGNDALLLNLEKLTRLRVDALVEYAPVMAYTLKQHGLIELHNAGCSSTADPLYIAFSPKQRNSSVYAKQLSDGMDKLRRNGKLAQILARYGLNDWRRNDKERAVK